MGTLSSETCTYSWYGDSTLLSSEAAGSPYCTWFYDPDYTNSYQWQCDSGQTSSFLCDAYDIVDECYYYYDNSTDIDCDGTYTQDSGIVYRYCCSTENCNYVDIEYSMETCTHLTAYEEIMAAQNECYQELYMDEAYRSTVCGDEVDELSCTDLKAAYTTAVACECDLLSSIYLESRTFDTK